MWDKTPCLCTFQDGNKSQNIWDKIFSYKSFVTKNEFECAILYVIPKSLSLYPLRGVVNGYNDILVTNILNYGFDRSHKI
jgi:hypothetical protein